MQILEQSQAAAPVLTTELPTAWAPTVAVPSAAFPLLSPLLAGLAIVLLLVLGRRNRRAKDRRLDLLDRALDRPDLGPRERADLVAALQAIAEPSRTLARTLFAAGWLAIFGGGFLLLAHNMWAWGRRQDYDVWGVALLIGGVALATLPLALRELEQRTRSPEVPPDQEVRRS